MKLQTGKAYRTRSGEAVEVGEMNSQHGHAAYGKYAGIYTDGGYAWWEQDGAWLKGFTSEWDLTEEIAG